jgi:RNA 2',3'-cyclic 3'-phosphodiesterase
MSVEHAAETLRLFWAVVPPPVVRARLSAAFARVPAALRPRGLREVSEANLHFTLHFLGSVAHAQRPQLEEAGRSVASASSTFSLTLGGLGAFPRAERAKVVWVGAQAGAAELCALAGQITDADVALGLPREERPFEPHLTLARLKVPAPVRELLGSLSLPALSFEVQALSLLRSHLSHEGARYEELARCPLRVA